MLFLEHPTSLLWSRYMSMPGDSELTQSFWEQKLALTISRRTLHTIVNALYDQPNLDDMFEKPFPKEKQEQFRQDAIEEINATEIIKIGHY